MKTKIGILVVCLLLISGTSYGAIVGQYDFDDGTADDGSGNSHNGTLVGDAVIINDAQRGKVLSLDGDGDRVDLGNGSWTNLGNNITIAAWIKVDEFDVNYQTAVAKGNNTYRLGRSGGKDGMAFLVTRDSGGYGSAFAGDNQGITVDDSQWHHIVGTYDGDVVRIYIDGQECEVAMDEDSFNVNTTDEPLWIGGNSEESARDWRGLIDDVYIYDNTLTATEVGTLYATTPEPATIALLGFGSLMFIRSKRK